MVDSIELQNVSRRFNKQWLFKEVNACFKTGDRVAVMGSNGSGKSSLTSIISGYLSPTAGNVIWKSNDVEIPSALWWQDLAWCSPALDLPVLLTIREVLQLNSDMRGFTRNLSVNEIIELSGLKTHQDKSLSQLSSGMRQRIKLLLAFYTDASVLILDEPTAHLDAASILWYQEQLSLCNCPLVFIASNHDANEIVGCNKKIEITLDAQVLINH
jgi:ABC-type multidrug transport system ATPase subunit